MPRIAGSPIKSRAAIGEYDKATARYTIHTCNGSTRRLHKDLTLTLDVPDDDLRLVIRDVGGNFGTRGAIFAEQSLVAWAARKVGRPVKWTSDRSEALPSDYQGRDLAVEAELALDEDGNGFCRLYMDAKMFSEWGWRIPFIVSLVLLVFSVYIRLRLQRVPDLHAHEGRGQRLQGPPDRQLPALPQQQIRAAGAARRHRRPRRCLVHGSVLRPVLPADHAQAGLPLCLRADRTLPDHRNAILHRVRLVVGPDRPLEDHPGGVRDRSALRYTSMSLPYHIGNGWFGGVLPCLQPPWWPRPGISTPACGTPSGWR